MNNLQAIQFLSGIEVSSGHFDKQWNIQIRLQNQAIQSYGEYGSLNKKLSELLKTAIGNTYPHSSALQFIDEWVTLQETEGPWSGEFSVTIQSDAQGNYSLYIPLVDTALEHIEIPHKLDISENAWYHVFTEKQEELPNGYYKIPALQAYCSYHYIEYVLELFNEQVVK